VGGIVADPKSHFVYVAEPSFMAIGVINTSTNELSSVIDTTAGAPIGLAISRDGTNLYVTLSPTNVPACCSSTRPRQAR
jgi:DNA-binding beta-propeller fold protein YncE